MTAEVGRLVREVRERFAADPRLAVFEIEVARDGDEVVLQGYASVPAAADELHRRAALLDGVRVRDEVRRLPADDHPHHVVVRSAVAPVLSGPDVSHPQVSQLVLGHRATVLRGGGPWYQVRGEDGYIGWTHSGYVVELDEAEARAWELGAGGRVAIALRGALLDARGEALVRLPFGARVRLRPDGAGELPDGQTGTLEGEFVSAEERAERFPPQGEAVVRSALRWLGAPYLWGGVTEGGVDCSGIVQRVFALHGVELPRDADLQARATGPLEPEPDLSRLPAGRLLFFREVPERITHVAISVGGGEVVHASLSHGGVVRSDLLSGGEQDEWLRGLLAGAARVEGLE